MSKSTLSQHEGILSGIELLSEDDQNNIQQKVKVAFPRLLQHVNCTEGIQKLLDRDIIIECIKFAFKDEFDSTLIDEVLKSSIHFGNFQDFLKINTLSYTGRNEWVESLKNRVEHVFENNLPDESFNSKQFTYIVCTHLILLCLNMLHNFFVMKLGFHLKQVSTKK